MSESTESESNPEPSRERAHRKGLTPEQRRLLGAPRTRTEREQEREREEVEETAPEAPSPKPTSERSAPVAPPPASAPGKPRLRPRATAPQAEEENAESPIEKAEPPLEQAEPPRDRGAHALAAQTEAARSFEMRQAFYIIAALLLLGAVFAVGLKFDRLRYMVKSRLGSKEFQNAPERFPGQTSAELMASGLAAEQRGDWQDAINRYMEAKQKDLHAPGLLFHVGKLATEHNDYEAADHAFEYAIKFGENLAASYQYRGLIAMRRNDFEAAERDFASSAATDPFPSSNYFFWGEALRALGRPAEAVRRYEEAGQRDDSASAKTLCRFKVRLARIEGTDAAAVEAEIRKMAEAGPLRPDWLLTDAALQIRRGEMKQASALISQARATGVVGTFLPFANDTIFRTAAAKFPEIAVALGPLTPIGTDTWNPKPLQLVPGLGRRGPLPRP